MLRFGILTTALPVKGSKKYSQTTYVPRETWREFHKAGQQLQVQVLFFRAEDVDFKSNRVHAWNCRAADGLSGWVRSYHPLPDVIYDCYYLRAARTDRNISKVRVRCFRRGIPVFNPALYDKAELNWILRANDATKRYIPPTIRVRTVHQVFAFLRAHKVIYLKPIHGTNGQGILEIRSQETNRVSVRSEKLNGDTPFLQQFSRNAFTVFMQNQLRKRNYLAQKGLQLIHKGKQKIDFRVVVHRDATGQWHSIGITPKLGKADSILTNTHAGGEKTTWNALSRWAQVQGVMLPSPSALEQPAIAAGKCLSELRPRLSHLGIDIAVCEDGKIYLLDVNARPGRDLLTPNMLALAAKYTVGFATYLANQTK